MIYVEIEVERGRRERRERKKEKKKKREKETVEIWIMGDGLTILNLVWDFCDMAKNGAEAGGSSNKVQELFAVAVGGE